MRGAPPRKASNCRRVPEPFRSIHAACSVGPRGPRTRAGQVLPTAEQCRTMLRCPVAHGEYMRAPGRCRCPQGCDSLPATMLATCRGGMRLDRLSRCVVLCCCAQHRDSLGRVLRSCGYNPGSAAQPSYSPRTPSYWTLTGLLQLHNGSSLRTRCLYRTPLGWHPVREASGMNSSRRVESSRGSATAVRFKPGPKGPSEPGPHRMFSMVIL